MVSVTASAERSDDAVASSLISAGLGDTERGAIERALAFIAPLYGERLLGTGEPIRDHAIGTAQILAGLRLDADTRVAGLLFAAPEYLSEAHGRLVAQFGPAVAGLVAGIARLNQLRVVTRTATAEPAGPKQQAQSEVLRKMLLAMVEDIRVVLLRLASRTQTLRFLTRADDAVRRPVARETLDIYAPLANRLGVWQLKWELEDLSFRFLEPRIYKTIAARLDERRTERAEFIDSAIGQLQREVKLAGIEADISGRPKHIYSIYNKMRAKSLEFSEVYDVRGVRVLVDSVRDCYSVLGMVHNLWQPIPKEFDDYISRPKGNFYRSLHTAVIGPDERALEVQIRTHDMHRHAELGVAAHWRYKEGGARENAREASRPRPAAGRPARGATGVPPALGDPFDDKIAWLRQVLAWRDEIVDASDWVAQSKQAALDDTVYVLTPQGHVIDLPRGSTPIDFAYALHSDLGHRCRGAKVNGVIVPLDRELENGERVEIIAARKGSQAAGPSRDWLNPALGYIRSSRARNKVRQWFNAQDLKPLIAAGRTALERELQREGATGAGHDELARRLGFDKAEDLYAAVERDEVGPRLLQTAIRNDAARIEHAPEGETPEVRTRGARAASASSGILVVGVDRLMTQLAKCCKPAPPDPIGGFITRGRGVSIHRAACASLLRLRERHPERVISADWGKRGFDGKAQVFSADIVVRAGDRTGLLRDISEILSREKINVTAVKTQSKQSVATMYFTVEIGDVDHLKHTLALIGDIPGVFSAGRR